MRQRSVNQAKIEEALTETLHAYEDLIADPEREWNKWLLYGNADSCRLCKLYLANSTVDFICTRCPLFDMDRPEEEGCSTDAHRNQSIGGFIELLDISGKINSECWVNDAWWNPSRKQLRELKRAAKVRYRWMLKRIKENGYVYR